MDSPFESFWPASFVVFFALKLSNHFEHTASASRSLGKRQAPRFRLRLPPGAPGSRNRTTAMSRAKETDLDPKHRRCLFQGYLLFGGFEGRPSFWGSSPIPKKRTSQPNGETAPSLPGFDCDSTPLFRMVPTTPQNARQVIGV